MAGHIVSSTSSCNAVSSRKIILECGRSVEVANFNVTGDEQTFTLARVFIDTSSLGSSPQVKIDFTTLIFFEGESGNDDIDILLTFKLNRRCGTADPSVLRTWQYRKFFDAGSNFGDLIIQESFTTLFCDNQECPDGDPREYYVEVTADPAGTNFTNIASAIVNPDGSAFISALAQC